MTAPGRMFVLTAAEMRAADEAAVAAGTPVLELMERAGAGAVDAIERHFGTQRGYRVHVVCGKGNNGGDGFVVARRLAERGAHVEVRLLDDAPTGAAKAHFDRLSAAGAALTTRAPARTPDLVVDAVLGTGARGALPAAWAAALAEATAAPQTRVVALDVPTGLDSDRGRALSDGGYVQRADLTVAFAHLKPVHVLYPGRALCGAIEVVDIGVEPDASGEPLELVTEWLAASLAPRRRPEAHKGEAGRVLVVGGSAGLTGAVVLASMSALKVGAGLVTAAVPESVNDAIESAMIEAMTWPLPESPDRALSGAAAPMIVARAREAQVVALGPGLSRAPESQELAWRVVADSPVPVVLDADGLNAFAGRTERLFAGRRRAALVVTPHLGELSRLSMATAGMGDVLTGVIAGFLAQGLAPYDAARLGVYVHGLAADLAHARVGTLGLVAGDVTAALPQAMHRLASAGPRSEVVPLPQTRIAPAPPDGIRRS